MHTMARRTGLVILMLALPAPAGALAGTDRSECTGQWIPLLDTDPDHPKTISGDSNAAYAAYSFWGDPSKKFLLQGKFPFARFFSVESNKTRWGFQVDAIFDFQMQADPGSQNPFQNGVALQTPQRAFSLEVLPPGAPARLANSLRLGDGTIQQSLLLRIYSPDPGVTISPADLPRIFAQDAATGEPVDCPDPAPLKLTLDLPEGLEAPVRRKSVFDFMNIQVPWGPNSAIPAYLGAAERMDADEVAVIRFKAPRPFDPSVTIFSDQSEVRYWSLCSENLPKLITLNCLPDSLAKVDSMGFVTVAFGTGDAVRQAANRFGYTYLEDKRAPDQRVAMFAYRNVLPSAAFQAGSLYQGDYRPEGALCDRGDFISGQCP